MGKEVVRRRSTRALANWHHRSEPDVRTSHDSGPFVSAGEQPQPADDSVRSAKTRLRQFAGLLAHSPDAIVIVDERQRICEWNPAAEVLFGWARRDILNAPLHRYVPPERLEHFEQVWATVSAGEAVPPYNTDRLRRDGSRTPVRVHMGALHDGDAFVGAVATLRSLPGRAAAAEVGFLDRDELTGLLGRRGLQRQLLEPPPLGLARGLAVLDVDAFALLNQTYGPQAGDDVLRELGRRLESAVGPAVVGRWQADEFLCVVDAEDPTAALDEVALAVLEAVRQPLLVAAERVHLTVSVGLVTRALTPDGDLLRAASAAMRSAKETGRDRAVWYDAALRPVPGGGMRLANDLHRGIGRNELRLLFQPIVAVSSGDVVGVEALVRWDRPGVGLVGPAYFIDVAERTGQIVPLGAWVMQQACQAAVDLAQLDGPVLTVSVNLSARQLSDPGLVAMLRDALEESGCPPAAIFIEVTETALMRDMGAAAVALAAIKALGVGLDLDDFGTGYSSLLYLKHFPVDRIKIDQSFVAGLGADADDTAIVASTISLAHSVGLRAVAEGVETDEQRALLEQMGCDFAQGYLFSGPLGAHQLHAWLQARRDSAGGSAGGEASLAQERDQAGEHRDHAADRRDHAAEERDHAGEERDHASDQRDQVGDERDLAADRRDRAADRRDAAAERSESGTPGLSSEARSRSAQARSEAAADRRRASLDRVAGAGERSEAELDRDTALADRDAGASERTHAELDRSTALADRGASARERETASLDDLTGAYLRAPGFLELEREIARARRTEEPLVLVFVDVDGLKAVNDSRGHAAGDRMLLEVANAFKARLRSHDLIIRYGGDEFVCVISGLTVDETSTRLELVHDDLAQSPEHGSVTVGLAELRAEDTPEDLIARADDALYLQRAEQRGTTEEVRRR